MRWISGGRLVRVGLVMVWLMVMVDRWSAGWPPGWVCHISAISEGSWMGQSGKDAWSLIY